jgi:hypothetical protein
MQRDSDQSQSNHATHSHTDSGRRNLSLTPHILGRCRRRRLTAAPRVLLFWGRVLLLRLSGSPALILILALARSRLRGGLLRRVGVVSPRPAMTSLAQTPSQRMCDCHLLLVVVVEPLFAASARAPSLSLSLSLSLSRSLSLGVSHSWLAVAAALGEAVAAAGGSTSP